MDPFTNLSTGPLHCPLNKGAAHCTVQPDKTAYHDGVKAGADNEHECAVQALDVVAWVGVVACVTNSKIHRDSPRFAKTWAPVRQTVGFVLELGLESPLMHDEIKGLEWGRDKHR